MYQMGVRRLTQQPFKKQLGIKFGKSNNIVTDDFIYIRKNIVKMNYILFLCVIDKLILSSFIISRTRYKAKM